MLKRDFMNTQAQENIRKGEKMSDYYTYDNQIKFKSWGKLKKQMEGLLCDKLKGKITYFFTSYSVMENCFGRGAINYEKTEIATFCWTDYFNKQLPEERKTGISREELMKEDFMKNCTLCEADFIYAMTLFLKTDIEHSLNSDNYLLRAFAFMDKRVGKRTLLKIKEEVSALPKWVQEFYKLRCEAESIN